MDDRWINNKWVDGWMKRGEGAIFCLLAFLRMEIDMEI